MSERTHWIFKDPCGCAFGVLDTSAADTRSKAWREFYEVAKDRNAAVDRGVTIAGPVGHDVYVAEFMPMLRSDWACPHERASR